MKISQKLQMNRLELTEHGPINIVIFRDSVSHGAFNGYIDFESVYWNLLRKRLNAARTYVPVNMICAAIGGTTASKSLPRLDSQVLRHCPDLVIVCFGLNDVNGDKEVYLAALAEIFRKCLDGGSEVVFLTPNMLNTRVADDTPSEYFEYAHKTAEMQNGGRMDDYIYSAKALAEEMGVLVCDCYSEWKRLAETKDTTLLLANRINHPTPEMHRLFADRLYELLMGEGATDKQGDDTMYQK
jgi:lysophospholipase L1-like esterase